MTVTSPARPETMRELVRDGVHAVHTAYLAQARALPQAERAALPLLAAGRLTVVAAAGPRLHLVAATDPLPAPRGPQVETTDEHDGLQSAVRFYDPSVLPELGLLAGDTPADVRRIRYARWARDVDRIRRAFPTRPRPVDELGICVRIGLDRACALPASDLTGGRVVPQAGTPAASCAETELDDVAG